METDTQPNIEIPPVEEMQPQPGSQIRTSTAQSESDNQQQSYEQY